MPILSFWTWFRI